MGDKPQLIDAIPVKSNVGIRGDDFI